MKPIEFRGSVLNDLRAFPQTAMREAGHQLDKVQNGLPPDDAKAMPGIGAGVVELRIWDEAGTFRVVYIAKLADAVKAHVWPMIASGAFKPIISHVYPIAEADAAHAAMDAADHSGKIILEVAKS